jgi:polyhydroxybutyrate depolymerase
MPKLNFGLAALLGLLAGPGCALENPAKNHTLVVDGVEREWILLVPAAYRAWNPAPLVLEFHGTGATPESQMELSGLSALAEQEGFLLVAPLAKYPRASDKRLTWNVDLHADAVDDVAFVAALIKHLAAQYSVDTDRIYATGFSGGARMSSRLACDLSRMVAAIGAVGGVRFPEDCAPARPVPVIAFHGRKDSINHYALQPDSPDYWRMGVEDAIAGWVTNNGCAAQPDQQAMSDDDARLSWPGCRDGAHVVFYRSESAGHTWPGTPVADRFVNWLGAKSVSELPATQLIWAFFEAHPLPVDPG